METKLLIPLLLGSGREGRRSEQVATYVHEQLQSAGFDAPFVDVRDYVTGVTYHASQLQPKMGTWKDLMSRADGLVIVTPEYNHGYPGELKIMLDSLKSEYARKPLGICGVSVGRGGGVRAIELLRLVALTLQFVPLSEGPTFGGVGKFNPRDYDETIKSFIDEMRWFATVLKKGRAELPVK
jgi:NAD(P)H-dependent FMN reductase